MDRKNTNTKTILIVDDQPVCSYGLQRMLAEHPEFEIKSYVKTLEEAFRQDAPDIIAVDISTAKTKGIAALKDMKSRFSNASILVITNHDELLFAERCLKAGATGYIMKTAGRDEVILALVDVSKGNLHVSSRMRERMLSRLSGAATVDEEKKFDRLSDRELLIVQHIGQSKNNKEIANELQISVKTIESHRSRIKAKLQLGSPNELVRFAMKLQSAAY